MREVLFLIGKSSYVLDIFLGGEYEVPDSRDISQSIKRNKNQLVEIVHSHPKGFDVFSEEDLSTMQGLELELGRSFSWGLVTPYNYTCMHKGYFLSKPSVPWWVNFMRMLSYINNEDVYMSEEEYNAI